MPQFPVRCVAKPSGIPYIVVEDAESYELAARKASRFHEVAEDTDMMKRHDLAADDPAERYIALALLVIRYSLYTIGAVLLMMFILALVTGKLRA